MRRLVLGDIHGAYKALLQVFEHAQFDHTVDQLIFLGDVVDGWPDSSLCIDELLKVKNLIPILGNHDRWCWKWIESGWKDDLWLTQGGQATINAYQKRDPEDHLPYFEKTKLFHRTEDNKLFVHGGISRREPIETQSEDILTWDRELMETALKRSRIEKDNTPLTNYSEIYIGHTSTERFSKVPIKACEVWCMDQGAGWGGKLSLMDIDTKTFWQSDTVSELYPNQRGR